MIDMYLLYFLMIFAAVSAVGVVTFRNIFHGAICLGAMLLGIAGIYLIMGAEFVFAVQVLVYVGGILTLILFAIMLTSKIADRSILQANEQKTVSFLISAITLFVLIYAIVKTPFTTVQGPFIVVDTARIGKSLFLNNILPFEVISILLLAALVGAIVLARKDIKK
ncbi:MAG: NADH-quinone oxidoreductase subunit J [Elusimicrobia bacterium]|nr:NADH-quinone oxidoreductase subunit J [Elusimicrobiota bacterium]